MADICFCVFCGHILWQTFVFVFFADMSCGRHFFLCFLRTYLVADISVAGGHNWS